MEQLRRTRARFVHCLLPQHTAGLCELRPAAGLPATPPKTASPEQVIINVPLLRSQVSHTSHSQVTGHGLVTGHTRRSWITLTGHTRESQATGGWSIAGSCVAVRDHLAEVLLRHQTV